MWKVIIRRLLMMIPQLIILSVLIFLLAKAMPGDPFSGLIGPKTDPKQIEALREAAGLNDPWWQQYTHWMSNALHGDFGMSYTMHLPVSELIGSRMINTFWLSLLAVILTYLIAIPMAIFAAKNEGSWKDQVLLVYNSITFGIPAYVIYLFAIFVFGFVLGWFPTGGTVSPEASGWLAELGSRIYHMILPATTMALLGTTGIFTYLRSGILDEQNQDYVKTARAKGVGENAIFTRHIFRNALLPIAANFGFVITGLLGGAIFAETIFGYPGLGQLFITAITSRDYSVITALILLNGVLALIGGMLSDIIMAIVDPRIRIE
ncbi:ABC transporter permease [Weissella halotolerans]|nr:ABC transporter permease [Weissella halotolerans]